MKGEELYIQLILINSFSKSVAQKLGLDMSIHDIGRSHVIRKVTNGRSQVIFKFLSYRMRNSVYTNKKAPKGDPHGIFYN